jgi:3-hydroxyacyl-CoA dehydrogenase
MTINKIAVIGSGVMGSGIAAQIANAGFLEQNKKCPGVVLVPSQHRTIRGPSRISIDRNS